MLARPQVILHHLDRKVIVNISESVFGVKATFPPEEDFYSPTPQ